MHISLLCYYKGAVPKILSTRVNTPSDKEDKIGTILMVVKLSNDFLETVFAAQLHLRPLFQQ